MRNTISITDARKDIFNLISHVASKNERYLLTENGRAKALLMSVEEFDSWQETLGVVQDFPQLDKDIDKAHKEYAQNEYITLDALLRKEGFIVADAPLKRKVSKQNEISTHSSKNSRKKTQ